jgi:hypothetical protein
VVKPGQYLKCLAKKDVVLLLDGSGSIGRKGWKSTIIAAKNIVSTMSGPGTKIAGYVYSGPKMGCDYYNCVGYTKSRRFRKRCKLDPEPACGTTLLTHFESDPAKMIAQLDAAVWPKRGTYTSKALRTAAAELSLGRDDADSVVIVLTDGKPVDKKSTKAAAKDLSKKAQVVWIPVTKYAPIKDIKSWASDPENVIPVRKFQDLEQSETINQITSTSCDDLDILA